MSSVTFVGILSELMPSGVLPQLMEDLRINEVQTGNMVGYYAIASAIFAIPLVSMTLRFNRKTILLLLLAGFAVTNMAAALLHEYTIIIIIRVMGGIFAGVMWPMIAAYGMRLVSASQQGKAIAIIMAGNTLGVSVGMPIMTAIGNEYGWRAEFAGLGIVIVVIALAGALVLPSTPGERLTKRSSPLALMKKPSVVIVLLLTLLGVAAHYGVYVYITSLVESIRFAGGIATALSLFGIGSLIAVLLAIRYTDEYLRHLTVGTFALLIVAMALLLAYGEISGIAHAAFFIWGLSFGPFVTFLQAAVSKQVETAKDVATSVQSSVFNLAILVATAVAGLLIGRYSPMSLPYFSIALALPGMAIAFLARRTLG